MGPTELIETLKPVILDALMRLEPHHGGTGGGRIFTGNYDWHSSVHAHWALLSMARHSKDLKLADQVLERLNLGAMGSELDFLSASENLDFEMPYGRVWLLVLLKEMNRHGLSSEQRRQLIRLQAVLENQLLEWLEKSTLPDGTGVQTFCATHKSWIFTLFMFLLSFQGRTETSDRVSRQYRRLDCFRAQISRNVILPTDFLYLPSLLMVMDSVQLGKSISGSNEVPELPLLPNTMVRENCHSAGAWVVRLWGAKPDITVKNLKIFLEQPDLWRSDFTLVSHWVPQFIWMAWIQSFEGGV